MSTLAVVKLSKPASWNGESERYLLCSKGVSVCKFSGQHNRILEYRQESVHTYDRNGKLGKLLVYLLKR